MIIKWKLLIICIMDVYYVEVLALVNLGQHSTIILRNKAGYIDNKFHKMKKPKDLYIITTARKRDTLEWQGELTYFLLSTDEKNKKENGCRIYVDSWNNIKKYANVTNAFFIFDEQRVVGYRCLDQKLFKDNKTQ